MIQLKERPDAIVQIVIPSGGLARYVWFEMSAEGVYVPQGSDIYRVMSGSPARGRNSAIREAMKDVTHFFFIDDDHWFDNDVVMKLLNHDIPIVAATVSTRVPPFVPLIFSGEVTDNRGHKAVQNYTWQDLDGRKGLIPVFAGPGAGLLVKREVFQLLEDPWFRVGQYDPEDLCEDIYFYEQARNAGLPIYVDLDTVLGHISPVGIFPVKNEQGVWNFQLMWENRDGIRLGRSDKPTPK